MWTRDLDSLIPRRIPEASKKDIGEYLIDAGFKQHFKDRNSPATEAYLKEIDGLEIEVEFLTDDKTRQKKGQNIAIAGVVAQPLPYLEQSIANTVEFRTLSGQVGRVVAPHA